jgi:hypothetical protein
VAGGGGHDGLRLRRGRSNAEQRATTQALMGLREELREVGKYWGRTEGQVHRRPAMAGVVDCGSGGGGHEEERRATLNRDGSRVTSW